MLFSHTERHPRSRMKMVSLYHLNNQSFIIFRISSMLIIMVIDWKLKYAFYAKIYTYTYTYKYTYKYTYTYIYIYSIGYIPKYSAVKHSNSFIIIVFLWTRTKLEILNVPCYKNSKS